MKSGAERKAAFPRRTWLVLAGAFLAATQASALEAASRADGDLAKAVKDHEEATIRSDIPALAGLVADDYVLVNSDSSLQNKEQYLADFRAPGFKVDSFAVEQRMQKVLGDAALTGGVLRLGWTQEGESHSRLLRIAHVWAKAEGRWRLTYTQLTRIPE